MTIVPETRSGKLLFYQTHVRAWARDPASIGLTTEAVETMQQLVDEANAAFQEHLVAIAKARGAVVKYHDLVRRMHAGGEGVMGGAALLQIIKTYAQTTDDPSVFSRARIT